jgi:hypothetical protein
MNFVPHKIQILWSQTRHYQKKINYKRHGLDSNQRPPDPRERELLGNLGKADRSLGYQVGCADHCTTTAFFCLLMGMNGSHIHTRCCIYVAADERVTANFRDFIAVTVSKSFLLA